ncbi:hypothetical protein P3S68_033912 [Capsicum galapagoense]
MAFNAVAEVEKMAIRTPLELSGQASEEESHRTGKIIQVTDIADFMTEEVHIFVCRYWSRCCNRILMWLHWSNNKERLESLIFISSIF